MIRTNATFLAVAMAAATAACSPGYAVENPAPAPVAVSTPAPAPSANMSHDMTIAEAADMQTRTIGAITWGPLEVPGFLPGAQIAVLHGDPTSRGDYALRLQFPDGYEFPEHWHPGAEHLTVLSGSFHLKMGGPSSASPLVDYAPGDFLYIPGRMSHSGGAKGVTVIQLHGTGPFAINLGAAK